MVRVSQQSMNEDNYPSRNFFRDSVAIMILIDPYDGSIYDVNVAAEEFYGYTRHEMRNMKIQDINSLTENETKAELEKARTQKRNFFRFHHKIFDGSIKNVEVRSGPITIKNREYLYSIVTDVTELTKFEKNLKRLESAIGSLINNLPVFHHFYDKNLKPLHNKSMEVDIIDHPLHEFSLSDICKSNVVSEYLKLIIQKEDNALVVSFSSDSLLENYTFEIKLYQQSDIFLLIAIDISDKVKIQEYDKGLFDDLKGSLETIKTKDSIISICAHCQKIRDRTGEWKKLHEFLNVPSLQFSHGLCTDCVNEHY